MHVRIKFCGLTRARDVETAESLGAEYVGVIFAGGPRNRTLAQAEEIMRVSRSAARVGVFGSEPATALRQYMSGVPLSVAQLHGDSSTKEVLAVRAIGAAEVWGVVPVVGGELSDEAADLFLSADAVVLDTGAANGLGGTGRSFDWNAVAEKLLGMKRTAKLVVAGGLNPDNVDAAIRVLHPDIVDVSSGVESAPGVKDPILMRRFAEAARSA